MKHGIVLVMITGLALAALAAAAHGGPDAKGRGEHWAALDTDGDGAISLDEARVGAPRMAEDFGTLDADGDGRVKREEMRQQRQQWRSASPEERRARAEQRFRSADANGDGAIDLAEAQTAMPRAAQHFGEIDADGDGLLTRDEMHSAAMARHTRGHRNRQPAAGE